MKITWSGVLSAALFLSTASVQADVLLRVGDDFKAKIAEHPPGTTFIIESGIHYGQSVRPRRGDSFIGQDGAVMSGAVLLRDGWQPVQERRNVWSHPVEIQPNPLPTHGKDSACVPEKPFCYRPEDLFLNDRFLERVDKLDDLGPGKWYLEYPDRYEEDPNARIKVSGGTAYLYVGEGQPSDHKIEMSSYRFAFGRPLGDPAAAPDVTIKNLIIEKYANSWQMGAIGNQWAGLRWTITDNEVRLNHAAGISFGSNALVQNNWVHNNGQIGIKGGGIQSTLPGEGKNCKSWVEDAWVDSNQIDHNRIPSIGFYVWAEGGGTKFACTRNLQVTNNYVHSNGGHGLWTDINNDKTLYKGNTVENNTDAGIFHEISRTASITENIVKDNGVYVNQVGGWGANIFINSSAPANPDLGESIVVDGNYVKVSASGGTGIIVMEEPRKVDSLSNCDKREWYLTSNVRVTNNTVIYGGVETASALGPTSQSGAYADWLDDNRACAEELSTFWSTVEFDYNSYIVPAGTIIDSARLWRWRRSAANAYLTFAEFQNTAGQEEHGRLVTTGKFETRVFPTLSPRETNLLGMGGALDTLYGLENLERVADSDDQYWTNEGEGRAVVRAAFRSDPGRLEVLTAEAERRQVLTVEGFGNDASGEGQLPLPDGALFRWGYIGHYSSVSTENPDGADHMVTWRVTQGPAAGKYVIAWEDRDAPMTDRDFQDVVIEVSNVRPHAQVNDHVTLQDTSTDYTADHPQYAGGVFRIRASFTNTSAAPISNPFFAVVKLSGGNKLINSDAGPGGTTLSPDVGANGIWSPGETVNVTFEIGLDTTARFSFFVDVIERAVEVE